MDSGVVVAINVHEFLGGHLDLCGEGVSKIIELWLVVIGLVVLMLEFLHKGQVVACCSSSPVTIAVAVTIAVSVSSSPVTTVPSSPVSHGWGVLWRAESESVGSSGT